MREQNRIIRWTNLAERFKITLPVNFFYLAEREDERPPKWKFLTPAEALDLKVELDSRFNYPDRQWNGIPFAVSNISEDIVCFDLSTPLGEEAMVLPIRDWHGPRWEYWGDRKTFAQWLASDTKGRLT